MVSLLLYKKRFFVDYSLVKPENNATYTIWGMAWLELPMRVVVSCDKLGRGAHIL